VSPNAVTLECSVTQELTAHPSVVGVDTSHVIELPTSSNDDNDSETAHFLALHQGVQLEL